MLEANLENWNEVIEYLGSEAIQYRVNHGQTLVLKKRDNGYYLQLT